MHTNARGHAQVTAALQVVMGLDGTGRGAAKVQQLHDNANYTRARLLEMGLDALGSWDSPVMPIMTYSPAKMVRRGKRREERRRGGRCEEGGRSGRRSGEEERKDG